MADRDVRFNVVAETGEAKRELDDLEKSAARVRDVVNRNGGGSYDDEGFERLRRAVGGMPPGGRPPSGGGGGGSGTSPGGGGGGNPPAPPKPGDGGEEFGKAAGKQIGRLIAAYMLHETTDLVFRYLRTPGQERPGLDMAQGVMKGALEWGTMGAMAGMAFGPWGAAIGGVGGLVAGGVSGYFGAELDERDKAYLRDRQKLGIDLEDEGRVRSLAAMKYMTAEGRLFAAAPREARVEMIGKEADALRKMLEDVTGRIKQMIDGRVDQTSAEFVSATQERADLAARLQQLEAMKFKAGLQDPLAMASAGDYMDAFSRRGLYVGAQVDVGNVNERIAAANEEQLEVLRQIADDMRNIATRGERTYPTWMQDQMADNPYMPITTVHPGKRGSAIFTH